MHGFEENQEKDFGEVYVCCSGWLNKSIGNYLKDDIEDVWNSQATQEIRRSIIDGDFKYCNRQACLEIQNDRLLKRSELTESQQKLISDRQVKLPEVPLSYFLCYDRSCNLKCKSCRNDLNMFKSGAGVDNPRRITSKLLKDVFGVPSETKFRLSVTGSGDPFVSDWSTWSKEEFEYQCIWRPDHPFFDDFLDHLRDPIFDHQVALLGPIRAYRQRSIQRDLLVGDSQDFQF